MVLELAQRQLETDEVSSLLFIFCYAQNGPRISDCQPTEGGAGPSPAPPAAPSPRLTAGAAAGHAQLQPQQLNPPQQPQQQHQQVSLTRTSSIILLPPSTGLP